MRQISTFWRNPQRVIYTVLFGEYETLNELQVEDPSVRAICFTDNPNLTSSTWEIIQIEKIFKNDPIRSQRLIKILGHPVLERFKEWLYIDNSVRLLKTPSLILNDYLRSADLAIPTHSFRVSVTDEFHEVRAQSLDSPKRLDEQLQHYKMQFPSSLEIRPLWTGIIARRSSKQMQEWSEIWAQHVLRYSRRDQLSVIVALETVQVNFNRIEIDNFSSDYHQWPIHNNRKHGDRIWSDNKLV